MVRYTSIRNVDLAQRVITVHLIPGMLTEEALNHDQPTVYWVGFNMVKGIGAVRFKALLDAFGSAEAAWNASPEAMAELVLAARL